jgi:hypothetical protein
VSFIDGAMNRHEDMKTKTNWIAWGITLGEGLLLLAFGIVLSQYWLMLPVWMRSSAGLSLGLAFATVGYRFFKFQRTK